MQMSELREAGKPMTSKVRLLAVDDDAAIRTMLDRVLDGDGFQVEGAATVGEALSSFQRRPPDLVLLDVMLAGEDGLDLLIELRRTHNVPVILLTGRGDEADRVLGLRMGADDYVVKPFSVRELILRIRALLRRVQRTEGEPSLIRFGRLKIDRDAHRAWVDEGEVDLTALEFRLLHAFLSRRGRVQTRDALLADVWGIDADVTTRTVDTHVKRLREKLGDAGTYIETLRGVGYRFKGELDEAHA
jgi:two-component system, OmpR family, phosphate regulon response regulator PhoB